MAEQLDPARLSRISVRALARHADEFAEFLLIGDGPDSWALEVECVIAFCGFTPTQFLEQYWAGAFDV